jgi:hypothetical protein
VIWKVNSSKEFYVYSSLIEYDKSHVWDRDKLTKMTEYCKMFNIQHCPIEETYLMHDNKVLMTRLDVTREAECYKLEMTISEASINKDTQRPRYVDMDR